MAKKLDLLAGYWTLAGDCYAMGPDEVSPFTLRERVEAASWAGYTGMGLAHQDLVHNAKHMGYPAMKRLFGDHGIVHFEVEYLGDWFKTGEEGAASARIRKDLLEAAHELGARDLKCCGEMWTDRIDKAMMADAFARLCEEARQAGTNIALEFMGVSNIPDLKTALDVVRGASQPNGGLCIDIWHFTRCGVDFSDIATLPVELIKSVEFSDAAREMKGTMWDDTLFHRLYPGEGSFDCAAFVKAVKAAGFDDFYSVEIINEAYRKLPLREQARRSFEGTAAQFL